LILPFIIRIWDKGYIWASIVLMVGVVVHMTLNSERRYRSCATIVGLPYMIGEQVVPGRGAVEPVSGGAAAAVRRRRPW
jgi:hypothetical protein